MAKYRVTTTMETTRVVEADNPSQAAVLAGGNVTDGPRVSPRWRDAPSEEGAEMPRLLQGADICRLLRRSLETMRVVVVAEGAS